MDFGFLAAANQITGKYLDKSKSFSAVTDIDEATKEKFGKEFREAYDSLTVTKLLSENMQQSYDATHNDNYREHAQRLGYSIDNRVIDMLHLQMSDDMSVKVNRAINNAVESL